MTKHKVLPAIGTSLTTKFYVDTSKTEFADGPKYVGLVGQPTKEEKRTPMSPANLVV